MNRFVKPAKTLCQKSHFHSTAAYATPRGTKPDKASKWGTFQRLAPASFAPINVRNMTRRPVPSHIMLPPYAATGESSVWEPHVPVHSETDLLGMRKACQLAREVLELGSTLCKPHVTTNEIDAILHKAIIKKNAYPSPLNYMGFPKSICTSINNVIAHGIPDDRPLQDGDFINIDITVSSLL
jgi:methionyl aminopeptidase